MAGRRARAENELRVAAGENGDPAAGLARTQDAAIGVTLLQEWRGTALGPRWKQVSDDKRSSFVGTFSYAGR